MALIKTCQCKVKEESNVFSKPKVMFILFVLASEIGHHRDGWEMPLLIAKNASVKTMYLVPTDSLGP
jgi:hypothetical protein